MELNDVLSSPQDNEADHDDRPTVEDEDVQSPEPQPNQQTVDTEQVGESSAKDARDAARMLNAYIEDNPSIDLFIKKFEREGGVRNQRKKSEDRANKQKQKGHNSSPSQSKKLKRSGSQRYIEKQLAQT